MKRALWIGIAVVSVGACVPYKDADDEVGSGFGGGFGPGSEPGVRPPSSGSGFGGRGGSSGQHLPGGTVSASVPPPPLSGGTLTVLADGVTAFAADPDRDLLYFADLKTEQLLATLVLSPGDEPGRVLETAQGGSLLVALRGSGHIARVDVATRTLVDRRAVCPAPRGIAEGGGEVFVACAGGELVTLAADTLNENRRRIVERDLRDIVYVNNKLFVSRFRSAELLVLSAADGTMIQRRRPPGSVEANRSAQVTSGSGTAIPPRAADPSVAWRMRANGSGGVTMLHQESSNSELGMQPGGYGQGGVCRAPVAAAMSEFPEVTGAKTGIALAGATLPIDFATSRDGKLTAIIAAGNRGNFSQTDQRVMLMTADQERFGSCRPPGVPPTTPPEEDPIEFRQPVGDPVAVALDGLGRVVVQTREPARLEIITRRGGTILLSDITRDDTGHKVFHLATASGLACASCHPEGGDDGRNWRFGTIGIRRTQNLRGGVLATAPFHWDGDMRDMRHLMTDVFSGRMNGPVLSTDQADALGQWIDRLPAMPALPVQNAEAVERGRVLFNDAAVGCTTCHSGSKLTNNQTVGVGTGANLQVPSLKGVGWRAPHMHDGCAATLIGRFDKKCGGDRHGNVGHLTPGDLGDLAAFMDTL